MSIKIIHKYCCPFIVLFIFPYATLAQQCLSRYLSAQYKATNWYIPVKAVATPGKEIVTVGNTRNDHGYITRLSSKASVLFSRQYNPIYQNNTTYFKNLLLNDVINTNDGLQVIAGTVIQDKYIYQSEYINNLGVLFKIDKFGRVLWSKKFESLNGVNNNGFELGITNVMERANGELLVFLSSDYGKNYNAYGKLVCLNKDGQLKWSFLLANGYDGKLSDNRALTETRDHSLVLSEILYKRDLQQPGDPVIARYLHIISINELGEINWEKGFILPTAGSASLANIKELENGNLALTGNIATKGIIEPMLLNRAVRIELNSAGNLVKTVSYNFPSENTSVIDVQPLSGEEQVYLLKNDHMAALAGLDPGGNINWQQGLVDPVNNFPATCFTSVGSGYAVFMSNFQSLYSRLLLTAEQGSIPCGNTVSFLTIDSFSFVPQTIKTNSKDLDPNRFAISDFPLEDGAFDLSYSIDCREIFPAARIL